MIGIRDVPDALVTLLCRHGYLEVPTEEQYACCRYCAIHRPRRHRDGQSVHSKLFLIDIDLVFRQLTTDGDDLSVLRNRQYLVPQIDSRRRIESIVACRSGDDREIQHDLAGNPM